SPRGRYLTGDAFEAIHKHLSTAELRDFFEFAYLCGTCKQQLARTTWAHLDAARWVLTWQATATKQHEPHVLQLAGRPLLILNARLEHGRRPLRPRVFHGPRCAPDVKPAKEYVCIGDFKRAWETACEKAGFPVGRKSGGYVFHNTRHSAVTNLVRPPTRPWRSPATARGACSIATQSASRSRRAPRFAAPRHTQRSCDSRRGRRSRSPSPRPAETMFQRETVQRHGTTPAFSGTGRRQVLGIPNEPSRDRTGDPLLKRRLRRLHQPIRRRPRCETASTLARSAAPGMANDGDPSGTHPVHTEYHA